MNKSDLLRQLWLGAVLLTRLPLPHLPATAFEHAPRAVWTYPLIGGAVGVVGAVAGQFALMLGLPLWGAATLVLGAMMLLTGAMHEDGLADVFDGFWGGFTPARRLEIMRDSQIGTYGVLALVIVCVAKISAVAALLASEGGWAALLAAAALSRGIMPVVMHVLPFAREGGLSHSVGQPGARHAALALGVGVIIAVVCLGAQAVLPLLAAVALGGGMAVLAKRKIGGQTGDVLGAVQQLSETAILLICAASL